MQKAARFAIQCGPRGAFVYAMEEAISGTRHAVPVGHAAALEFGKAPVAADVDAVQGFGMLSEIPSFQEFKKAAD